MTSRPPRYPWGTLAHLSRAETEGEVELAALARLEGAGVQLGLLAIPAAVEDGFYRSNDLPRRLAALYRGLDPADPDEDILDEAEPAAAALLGSCYLLDDVVDAFFDALGAAPGGAGAELVVRRAGAELAAHRAGTGLAGQPGEAVQPGGGRASGIGSSGSGSGGSSGSGSGGSSGGGSGGSSGGGRGGSSGGGRGLSGRGALLAMKRLYLDDWRAVRVAARLAATGRLGIQARPVLVHGNAVGTARVSSLLAGAEVDGSIAKAGGGNQAGAEAAAGQVVSLDRLGAVVALSR